MEFTFTTAYDQKAFTAMARALRKTTRKAHSRRMHIFGWIIIVLGFLLSWPFGQPTVQISGKTVVTWLVLLVILITLIWEDAFNGYLARKRNLPGLTQSVVTFTADGYHHTSEVGQSDFPYHNIVMIAETQGYFVFLFSKNHAQVYAKDSLTGGTADAFRQFIQERTDKTIQTV